MSPRQTKLCQILEQPQCVGNRLNNVETMADKILVNAGPKASGGHILSHASQTILSLKKGRGDERVAKVIDSPGKF